MKFKWLVLSVFSLALICIFGYKLDSEQLRTSLMTAISGGHAEAATRSDRFGSFSDNSLPSATASSTDRTIAADKLGETSFQSELLRTSLIKAVRADNVELARKLIKLGADVNSRTSATGWSALHYAVRNGDAEMVQLLLKGGADPNCLGTIEGQSDSADSVKPLVLAEAALDLVNQVPPSDIETTLRQSGLNDPALLRSMTDPDATDRYQKIVEVLTSATRKS